MTTEVETSTVLSSENVKPLEIQVAPERPPVNARYWVNWPFESNGYSYERGEAIRLVGAVNDEKLVRIGYVKPLSGEPRYECGACGKKFIEEKMRDGHGRKFHRNRFADPAVDVGGPLGLDGTPNVLVDKEFDNEERRLMATASLNWDRTAASLNG